MFERFTERTREVMVRAQRLAADEKSPNIRRHHLMIGLIDTSDEGSQSVATVFEDANVDRAGLRAKLLDSLRASEKPLESAAQSAPFTREAKKTLELSLREALSLGHNYIGREHLLLGILREADGPLRTVLGDAGLQHERARQIVAEESPPSRGRRRGGPRAFRFGRRTTDGLQAVLNRTFERADRRDATTGDLLVALLQTPGTHFAAAVAGYQLPPEEAARVLVDKLVAENAPDGSEGAVLINEGGAVLIKNPRVAEAVKKIIGEQATPEGIEEILRRLEG